MTKRSVALPRPGRPPGLLSKMRYSKVQSLIDANGISELKLSSERQTHSKCLLPRRAFCTLERFGNT